MEDQKKTNALMWLAGISLGGGAVVSYAIDRIRSKTNTVSKAITINCSKQRLREQLDSLKAFPNTDVQVKQVHAVDSDTYNISISGGRLLKGDVSLTGTLKDAPSNWGTEFHVVTRVSGLRALGFLSQLPTDHAIYQFLSALKQIVEVGEISTTLGQPAGRHVIERKKSHIPEIEDNEQRSIAS